MTRIRQHPMAALGVLALGLFIALFNFPATAGHPHDLGQGGFVDGRCAVGIRLKPAAAMLRQYGRTIPLSVLCHDLIQINGRSAEGDML